MSGLSSLAVAQHVGSQFPDQGSNPHPLHWKADSYPLAHQSSPSPCDSYPVPLCFCQCHLIVMPWRHLIKCDAVATSEVGCAQPFMAALGLPLPRPWARSIINPLKDEETKPQRGLASRPSGTQDQQPFQPFQHSLCGTSLCPWGWKHQPSFPISLFQSLSSLWGYQDPTARITPRFYKKSPP